MVKGSSKCEAVLNWKWLDVDRSVLTSATPPSTPHGPGGSPRLQCSPKLLAEGEGEAEGGINFLRQELDEAKAEAGAAKAKVFGRKVVGSAKLLVVVVAKVLMTDTFFSRC